MFQGIQNMADKLQEISLWKGMTEENCLPLDSQGAKKGGAREGDTTGKQALVTPLPTTSCLLTVHLTLTSSVDQFTGEYVPTAPMIQSPYKSPISEYVRLLEDILALNRNIK